MKRYRIGKIVNTHGLKGEVKVYPHTDDMSRFEDAKYLIFEGTDEKLEIESIRYQKAMVYLKFKGKDKIEQVEPFLQREVYVDEENMRELEEDEYMIDTLIGLDVFLQDGQRIGMVKDLLQYSANDVLVLECDGKEVLIPFLKQFVPQIDIGGKKMIIAPIKGMIEE